VAIVAIVVTTAVIFPHGRPDITACGGASYCGGLAAGYMIADFVRPWLWGTLALLIVGKAIWIYSRSAQRHADHS